ncbi:hypothetical protein AAVH_41815 [Aphelenchoides avenae]|nr:hypothetical protein AAVH_41815 [Aphelenchus avenae]
MSPPEETHFKCGLLRTDLPPSEEVEPGNEHAYFVKETSANGINLRVDCEIIEGTESVDGSFSDDYTDSEDSVSTAAVVKTPSASDDDFRCCDSDSVISFVHLFMP